MQMRNKRSKMSRTLFCRSKGKGWLPFRKFMIPFHENAAKLGG